ncbi:NAD-dependent epimerase/dehydratase family protein [Actinopolymorpha singaporensis]|uniref:Nucleoside-diphosphate-sugar epimerase n=1 Tax=Actinopolymorpha singaporensis TaxID=117157 RepID=A0A1H1UPD4_9ACTN|nr:NAD(P)-dependent oxidoreductase [Actinopolymorpha singaporensis]SDS74140.1 Nucleoside-diphosphate-sugar epimerase [Actinopolymorpha singaporensis]
MRIAITGAAGWLGRYVTAALETSHELVLIDNVAPEEATIFDPSAPGGRRRLPLSPSWPYHHLDILDDEGLSRALTDVEVVVHLAGRPTGEWENAKATVMTNIVGTFNVFDQARMAGARRVVNASSINAFGTFYWRVSGRSPMHRSLPLTEDEPVTPEDPYSMSKATTEVLGATFNRAFGFEAVNLRFAGVWSESTYDAALDAGLPATKEWADDLFQWVHVLDVTQGITKAALVDTVVPVPITLAAADTRAPEPTLEVLAKLRPELIQYLCEPLPKRAGLLSIARARTFLGYEPRYSLDAAVRDLS